MLMIVQHKMILTNKVALILSTILSVFGMNTWQCVGAGHDRRYSQMCMKSRQPRVELSSKC